MPTFACQQINSINSIMPIDAEDNSAGFSPAVPHNNGSTDVTIEAFTTSALTECLPLEPLLLANSESDKSEKVSNTPSEKEEDISPSPTNNNEEVTDINILVASDTINQIARTTRQRQPPDSSTSDSPSRQESTNSSTFQATIRVEKDFNDQLNLAVNVKLLPTDLSSRDNVINLNCVNYFVDMVKTKGFVFPGEGKIQGQSSTTVHTGIKSLVGCFFDFEAGKFLSKYTIQKY